MNFPTLTTADLYVELARLSGQLIALRGRATLLGSPEDVDKLLDNAAAQHGLVPLIAQVSTEIARRPF